MALNFSAPETTELKPRILVFGVGGAGGNAVNNMIEAKLEGVDFAVANTDAQALSRSKSDRRIQLGATITEGLGAGARPEVGEQAAEDSLAEISEQLHGAHMVFITAGMGGGTGTGAAPIIARAAREQNILTVGVVTKPFHFEGTRRMRTADEGIEALQQHVDTLIIIPNQNLFRVATEKTTMAEAFTMADDVLRSGVRGITDLMVMPGLINLDFADVRAVMNEMGKAMMGTGEAGGEKRAIEAAHNAINNPLLDDVSMKGAKGVLINITGGMDMTLYEVDEAANEIRNEVDPDANIIVGSTFDDTMDGSIRVSVVATGIDAEESLQAPHARRTSLQSAPASNVTTAWRAREAKPQVSAEPFVRRANEPAVVNATGSTQTTVQDDEAAMPAPSVASASGTASAAMDQTIQSPMAERSELSAQASSFAQAREAHQDMTPSSVEPVADAQPNLDKPAVLASQERLERELSTRVQHEHPRAQEAREERGPRLGLSLFGRRAKPVNEPKKDPLSAASRTAATAPAPVETVKPQGADLFGNLPDDAELEIPAFLRRQAN